MMKSYNTTLGGFLAGIVLMLFTSFAGTAQEVQESGNKVKFSWGAEAGASIDLTGQEMSAIDFNASFGMKYSWVRFLGIGVGADIAISNSCRSYPLYVDFRTNFRKEPSLFFWAVKCGVALNYLQHNAQQTSAAGYTGLGINLAQGRKFSSYMLIGYSFRNRKDIEGGDYTLKLKPIHYASVRLGVSF